ncbi:hypothetical protein [Methylomicrobium sp. Wu6]|uniref:hypothetical protein n=1 Tax=Methylomicrobium sp. Wu6 TaxID=3107928 RepID=UPI002DD67155|nr:hypothetical protein [Methylomicrobium sp. Wu6]MEC4748248.1 hypothetical protein [Methylomicrobium sp. Wu6]
MNISSKSLFLFSSLILAQTFQVSGAATPSVTLSELAAGSWAGTYEIDYKSGKTKSTPITGNASATITVDNGSTTEGKLDVISVATPSLMITGSVSDIKGKTLTWSLDSTTTTEIDDEINNFMVAAYPHLSSPTFVLKKISYTPFKITNATTLGKGTATIVGTIKGTVLNAKGKTVKQSYPLNGKVTITFGKKS